MSTDGVLHIVGMDVQVGPLRRQRCAWCGQLLLDEDLSLMAWPLNEDGTDPGAPNHFWPMGACVEVFGEMGSFRVVSVIPEEDWPDSVDDPGFKRLPDACCARLDPAVTA